MIIGLLGKAGVGKDTVAQYVAPIHPVEVDGELVDVRALVAPATTNGTNGHAAFRAHAAQISLIDRGKEFCRKLYGFSFEQLWGPSTARDAPDERYPRVYPSHVIEGGACTRCKLFVPDTNDVPCKDYLSPREALQRLGIGCREQWSDSWIQDALDRAFMLLSGHRIERPKNAHTFAASWVIGRTDLVIIDGLRFENDVQRVLKIGGEVWLIDRPSTLEGKAAEHITETTVDEVHAMATRRIANHGTLDDLYSVVGKTLAEARL